MLHPFLPYLLTLSSLVRFFNEVIRSTLGKHIKTSLAYRYEIEEEPRIFYGLKPYYEKLLHYYAQGT